MTDGVDAPTDAAAGGVGGAEREAAARAGRRQAVAVAFVGALVLGGGARVWQTLGRRALAWGDSTDFLGAALEPWLSVDLWAGPRSVGVPALLKLVGRDVGAYADWQATLAAVSWAALAASVVSVVAGAWRWVAGAAVVAFSLTTPATMWDRSALSESPSLSVLALVGAAGLQLVPRPTAGWVAALVAVVVAWLTMRDSHAAVVLAGGAVALVVAGVSLARSRLRDGPGAVTPRWRRPVATLGVVAVVLGLLAGWGSSHGRRHAYPMRNVFEVRVLPYPDRVEWFADHGMPQSDRFVGPDARAPYREPGLPPVVYIADDDPDLGPWRDWVATDGRLAFARFVATHPAYLVTEPFEAPERAFNNARGDRQFYAPPDMRRVPLVDGALGWATPVVLVVAVAVAGWATARRSWPPALVVGTALAALSVPHGLFAWHSDGMETARHLVVPAMQLRLGVLLMLVGALTGPDPSPPAD